MGEQTNGGDNEQQERSETEGSTGGKQKANGESQSSTRDRVLTATALSLAAGTSFFAARKALSAREDEHGDDEGGDDEQQANGSQPAERGEAAATRAKPKPKGDAGLLATLESVSWDRVGEMLLPLAEKAATTAGEYIANEGPEILTDRLLPRFIDSFNGTRARKSS